MVSGTDEHGTPILVLAEKEGLSAQEVTDKYNRVIATDLTDLGLSYDLFTRTTTANHYAVAQELFTGNWRNGYMIEQTTRGAISPSTGRTPPTATSRAPARSAATARRAATSATTAATSSTPTS